MVWGIILLIVFISGTSLFWKGSLFHQLVPDREDKTVYHFRSVRIGVTIANDEDLERYLPLIMLAEEDIAAFCEDSDRPFRFDFVVRNCESQAQIAENLTVEFHENGTDLIVGHPWSGMMCHGVQEYINESNMLLLSPSSTSPHWGIPGDNMFRLACPDPLDAPIIAEALHSRDIKAIVIIERDDEWGNLVCDEIEVEFTALGGIVSRRVPYKSFVNIQVQLPERSYSKSIPRDDYSELLVEAEDILNESVAEYGLEYLAVEFVGFSEAKRVIVQALGYPTLSVVSWYGYGMGNMSETPGLNDEVEGWCEAAVQLGLIGPTASPSYSREYWDLNTRYENKTGFQLDFTGSNYYDGCCLYALSVMKANSTDVTLVKDALREFARNYIGVSGHCELDENDDRLRCNYDLMGYFDADGECQCLRCGFFNATTSEITWNEDLMPLVRGGG